MNEIDFDYLFRESIAYEIEMARQKNYDYFNNTDINNSARFQHILENTISTILHSKNDSIKNIEEKVKKITTMMVEHLTGDYQIGLGDKTFEELDRDSESMSSIVGYSPKDDLEKVMEVSKESDIAKIIVDGSIKSGFIETDDNTQKLANENFEKSDINLKSFFKNSVKNIVKANEKVATLIAKISGFEDENKQGLNDNITGKLIGGLAYEFLSGTLISKRHFTDIENSQSMKELIEKEGIVHFTSPENAKKIMESGKVKTSNFLESDVTKKKSFFFAGTPKFEDLLINIPAYNVMTAVRIRPTEEQMKKLKYRAINDRAVVQDGDFYFEKEQAEIAYYGLKYDKEKDSIYLDEITKEEAEKFKPSEEVTSAYSYKPKKNSIKDNIKLNAYGFFAEYKHHRNLLQMQKQMEKLGITSLKEVSDSDLVKMDDIEEAYISTKNDSSERKSLFDNIKQKIFSSKAKKQTNEKESIVEDGRDSL